MKIAGFIVCDRCGNDSWYLIGPNSHGETPLCQVQICTKCGFALILMYELIGARCTQVLDLADLFSEEEIMEEVPIDGPRNGGRLYDTTVKDIGIHKKQ